MIIGVTGKSGVGKTTYCQRTAKEQNLYPIHIDEISHKVFEEDEIKDQFVNIFGSDVLNFDGTINRKYAGDLIFENRKQYKELNQNVWIRLQEVVWDEIDSHEDCILDWILLPHSPFWNKCNKKILIEADNNKRINKVLSRDNISREYLIKRDNAGIDYSNIKFDEVIFNDYL